MKALITVGVSLALAACVSRASTVETGQVTEFAVPVGEPQVAFFAACSGERAVIWTTQTAECVAWAYHHQEVGVPTATANTVSLLEALERGGADTFDDDWAPEPAEISAPARRPAIRSEAEVVTCDPAEDIGEIEVRGVTYTADAAGRFIVETDATDAVAVHWNGHMFVAMCLEDNAP